MVYCNIKQVRDKNRLVFTDVTNMSVITPWGKKWKLMNSSVFELLIWPWFNRVILGETIRRITTLYIWPAWCLRGRMRLRCVSVMKEWSGMVKWFVSETLCCFDRAPGRNPSRTLPKYQRCGKTPKQVREIRAERSHKTQWTVCMVGWILKELKAKVFTHLPLCVSICRLRRADDESFLVLPTWAHPGGQRSQRTLWGEASVVQSNDLFSHCCNDTVDISLEKLCFPSYN